MRTAKIDQTDLSSLQAHAILSTNCISGTTVNGKNFLGRVRVLQVVELNQKPSSSCICT